MSRAPSSQREPNIREAAQLLLSTAQSQGYLIDPYAVLGVPSDATQTTIQQRYRLLMRQYHPDLFASAAAELRQLAERRCNAFTTAYDILCDSVQRAAFDCVSKEWRGAVSRDGTPLIVLGRTDWTPLSLLTDPTALIESRREWLSAARTMSGFNPGLHEFLEKQIASGVTEEAITKAYHASLSSKQVWLELEASMLRECIGLPPEMPQSRSLLLVEEQEREIAELRSTIGERIQLQLMAVRSGQLQLSGAVGEAPASVLR